MEPSQISSENGNTTTAKAGRKPNMAKRLERVWMRLALLFIIVVLFKGLLFACATLLLRSAGLQSNTPGDITHREMLQLRANLQRLTALLTNITKDSRCQLCPKNWHWYYGHCYFFSVKLEDDRMWEKSVDYCREQNASLAVIQDDTEMEFILDYMETFPELPFLWLGLTDSQEEGIWMWQDGTPLHKQKFINLQWDSEERDCADLRGGGSVFASDCKAYGPWLCEKPMEPPELPHSHISMAT